MILYTRGTARNSFLLQDCFGLHPCNDVKYLVLCAIANGVKQSTLNYIFLFNK